MRHPNSPCYEFIQAVESGELEALIKAGANKSAIIEKYDISDATIRKYTPRHLHKKIAENFHKPMSPVALFNLLTSPTKRLALCERWA